MPNSGSPIKPATPLEQLVIWLRDDLSGEIDAINQYQWHHDNIDNEEIKQVLAHIRDEEKEHLAELVKLIARIDDIQKQKFLAEGDDLGHGHPSDAEIGESIAGIRPIEGITIGSLKAK